MAAVRGVGCVYGLDAHAGQGADTIVPASSLMVVTVLAPRQYRHGSAAAMTGSAHTRCSHAGGRGGGDSPMLALSVLLLFVCG